MALKFVCTQIDNADDSYSCRGTLTPSGNYATGGDVVDLTAATYPLGSNIPVQSGQLPRRVLVNGATGDDYGWIPGTTLANGKVKCNTTSATELAAGPYPARILADTIYIDFVFDKSIF